MMIPSARFYVPMVLGLILQVVEVAYSADVYVPAPRKATDELEKSILGETVYSDFLMFDGEIDRQATSKAIALLKDTGFKSIIVNSSGGDVDAAMELGRYLRQKDLAVTVRDCASACLLLIAGAVERNMYFGGEFSWPTRLGVHRPYSTGNFSTTNAASKDFKRTNDRISDYLHDMNISTTLLDIMNSTAPESVRWLTPKETLFYFPRKDPAWQDKEYSAEAAKKGISKQEYISRRQQVNVECRYSSPVKNATFDQLMQAWERGSECEKRIMR